MAKYDFENSRYAKLWNSVEGRQLISYILNDPNLIHVTPNIWSKNFEIDPYITPTAHDGTTSFSVEQRPLAKSNLMHAVAPLGDTITRGEAAAERCQGTVGEFVSDGYVEKAMERKYREDLASQLGTDASIVNEYVTKIQTMIDSGHQTLDFMSAFALSHGYVRYEQGQGIKRGYYKAPIPAENFLNAGAKVWTATDCDLLTQMRAIEKKMKEQVWGLGIALKWQMPYDIYHNVFLKNAEVINYVKDRIQLAHPGVTLTNPQLVYNDIEPWIQNIEGLSPIEVVENKAYDNGTIVSGWATGKVVLRPQGFAGKIIRGRVLDEEVYSKYGNDAISRAFGRTSDGLMVLMNSVHPDGNLKEWQSMVKMAAMPVLDDFLYHCIIDTTTAG